MASLPPQSYSSPSSLAKSPSQSSFMSPPTSKSKNSASPESSPTRELTTSRRKLARESQHFDFDSGFASEDLLSSQEMEYNGGETMMLEDNMEDLTNLRVPELRSTRSSKIVSSGSTGAPGNGNRMNSKEQIENYPTKVRSEGSGRSSPVMERQSSTSPTFTSRLPRMKSQNTLREEKVENKVAPSRREADELDRSVGNSRYDGGREIKSEPASIASSAKKPRLNLTTNPSPSISSDLNSSTSSTNSESPKQNGSRSKSPPSTTPFPTSKSSRPRSGSSTVPLSQKEQLETKSLPTRTRAQTSNLQSKPKSKPNTTRLRNGSSIKRRDSTETGAQPSWALSEPLMFMEDLDEASAFGLNGRSPSATNLDNVVLPVVAKAIRAKMLARSNTAEDILITTYDKNHNPIGAARIRTPSPNPQNIPAVESIEQSIYQIDSIAPLSKQPSYQEIRKHSISQNYSRPIFTHSPLPLSSPDLSPRLHRLNNPGRESENWNEGFGNGEIVSAFDHDEKGKKKDDGHEGGCCSCVIC